MEVDFQTINEIVTALQGRLDSCWQFYLVVVLGTLGWLFGQQVDLEVRQALILSAGLGLFFVVNLWLTLDSLEELNMALAERKVWVEDGMFKTRPFVDWLRNDDITWKTHLTWTMQLCIDVAVIRIIWLQVHQRSREQSARSGSSRRQMPPRIAA